MFKKKRNIGKLLLGSFLIVAVLTACMEEKREMKIDMLSRPGTIDRNVSYQGNRLPLKPLHFIKLPVGTIEPEGWLKKYLLLQKDWVQDAPLTLPGSILFHFNRGTG